MYYLIYGFLYLISLLPFFILYRISDLAFFIIYYVVGYRKKIVMANLEIAFPEKSIREREKIAREFYLSLTDTFIETIKMLSVSEKTIRDRMPVDMEACHALAAKGKNIQYHSGHHFNWEYANWALAMRLTIPWIGIYMRINNPALDKLFYNLRSKKGTKLVAAQEFKSRVGDLFNEQYAIGLVADQNPGVPKNAFWLNFFNRPTPFVTGPDKGAIRNRAAVVFVKMVKERRGYYRLIPTVITEDAGNCAEGELTLLYRDFLEKNIREQPFNYLWSHRRWKWSYNEEFEKKWIDHTAPVLSVK